MGSFGTIVGFIFSFLIISGTIVVQVSNLSKDVETRSNFNHEMIDKLEIENSKLDIISVNFNSGRLRIELENTGDTDVFLKNSHGTCPDIFINNKFISKENIVYLSKNNIFGDYSVIKTGEIGTLEVISNINISESLELKIISCGGFKLEQVITEQNWYSKNFTYRSQFDILNGLGSNQLWNSFSINLDSSNLDFSKVTSGNLHFKLPLSENSVLDLNFDNYQQSLEDFSPYLQTVSLGTDGTVASDDPQELNEGVYFKGLDFDGMDDFIRVSSDSTLAISDEITISMWIKWNILGDSEQGLYYNGRAENKFSIFNSGPNANKLLFSLRLGPTRTVYSNQTISDSDWHLVTAVYDKSNLEIFIDAVPSGKSARTGSISSQVNDNFIGSLSGNNYFNGSMDEVRVYNIALTQNEIENLYYDELKFRNLNYSVVSWNAGTETGQVDVELPFIIDSDEISVDLYY